MNYSYPRKDRVVSDLKFAPDPDQVGYLEIYLRAGDGDDVQGVKAGWMSDNLSVCGK